ncbi:unnamed protein product [Auanema sp. JU1783]|nr:unnamed protein product [Auanema sp. JU1783]
MDTHGAVRACQKLFVSDLTAFCGKKKDQWEATWAQSKSGHEQTNDNNARTMTAEKKMKFSKTKEKVEGVEHQLSEADHSHCMLMSDKSRP